MSDPNIAEAIAASEFFTADDAAYKAYLDREMAIMDYNTDMKVSREEGRNEGENRMGQLIEYLLRDGKTEMISAIAQDSILRQELFAQYGI